MRRNVSLYIAGMPVDLDDQSFILFNYTMEEISNPTIVKNSFSKSISLKGTPNNNKIFGDIYRADRKTQYGEESSGVYFDPTRKTPFVLYNEMNEILEEGYMKLDKISNKGGSIEYNITLFGGLGSFFYGLSYDEEGNKRTLADLQYIQNAIGEQELDFIISKNAVLDAWQRLNGDKSKSALWDIINFAPAYNGLPSGTFDADKALVFAENAGLLSKDGDYMSTNGYVLVNMPKKHTDIETKDLRSYLQRPVLRMKSVIDAICNPINNGGYSVELDKDFFNANNPYYQDTWITLPLLESLTLNIREMVYSLLVSEDQNLNLPGGDNPSATYIFDLRLKPFVELKNPASSNLYLHSHERRYEDDGRSESGVISTDTYFYNYIEYTLKAFDSNSNLLNSQKAIVASTQIPFINAEVDALGYFNPDGTWAGDEVQIYLETTGASYIRLEKQVYALTIDQTIQYDGNPNLVWTNTEDFSSYIDVKSWSTKNILCSYRNRTSEAARSGAVVSKSNLLSTKSTPADYLLSFCKMFGLHFITNKGAKKIQILSRKNFFREEVVDLSKRINLGESIENNPFSISHKWYNFGLKYDNGEFAKYYANVHNTRFGLQKVNTGYEFNSESKEIMDGVLFNGATEVLENSKYYVDIMQNGKYIPSVFLDAGGSYTLKKGNGDTQEYDVPTPAANAIKSWLNPTNKTFDIFSKLQFHNKENATYEERDTLVFFRGMKNMTIESSRYAVTDDTPIMMTMNENVPCWLLDYQLIDESCRVTIMPLFSRYIWNGSDVIKSLDFGTPKEVAIPEIKFQEDSSLYQQYWSNYIADRYDDDSKVMTCKVNLCGMQVNEELLRKFYYWDGALWALNKIVNHSFTTWDDTECEFVKVQDINNYTNGQKQ